MNLKAKAGLRKPPLKPTICDTASGSEDMTKTMQVEILTASESMKNMQFEIMEELRGIKANMANYEELLSRIKENLANANRY